MTVVARDDPLHPGDEGTSALAPPPALAKWREQEPVRRISVSVTGPGLSPAQRRLTPDAVTSARTTCSSVSVITLREGLATARRGVRIGPL